MKKTMKTLLFLCLSLILCVVFLTSCDESNLNGDATGNNELAGNTTHTHTLGEWTVVKEPTEKETGLKEQKCTICGETVATENIPAIGSSGLSYILGEDGKTCTITGIGTCTDTDVVIPAFLEGYEVTAIEPRAFENSGLTSVVIQDGVTYIGYNAFGGCNRLTSVVIADSVKVIHTYAFTNCSLTSVYYQGTVEQWLGISIGSNLGRGLPIDLYFNGELLTELVIPENVTSIRDRAFQSCGSLTSVVIPDSVTSIGVAAFSGCGSLTSVVIPDSVTSIGGGAFRHCKSLTSVVIPDGVTSIGDSMFEECKSLTSVVIPDGVTSIGEYVFSGCESLTSVVIPDGVTSIGNSAFSGCIKLTSVVIPDGVTSIGREAFRSCNGLTSVVIPDSVTTIADNAFETCLKLTSVVIGNGVTSIGKGAFSECVKLTSVVIGSGVTSIGNDAFRGFNNLSDVQYIGTKAEWEAIEKGSDYLLKTYVKEIVCSDGKVSLS